jgi:UPF0755 protein
MRIFWWGWRIVVVVAIFVVWFSWYTMLHARGGAPERLFHINQGESVRSIAERLEEGHVIVSQWLFLGYLWEKNLRGKTVAGDYLLSGQLTIPEVALKLTQGEVESFSVTVTFPEGWESRRIAERLMANKLPGEAFLNLVQHPKPEWRDRFTFLQSSPKNASLEGFLFPDTYTFYKAANAEDIIVAMLGNFEKHWNAVNISPSDATRSPFAIVTMASIVENEVTSTADRKLVADLFWRRIAAGQRLESDATVKYILQENKIQHTFEETRTDSPYNTYTNKGLPPGPIGNPGIDALGATLHPTPNQFVFFLSDAVTGETVFAKTFEEHVANKKAHGL